MTSTAILALILLFAALATVGFLLRKSSRAQVELATLQERLLAKEEEVANLSSSLDESVNNFQSQSSVNYFVRILRGPRVQRMMCSSAVSFPPLD